MTDSAKPTPEPLEIERRPNVMTIEEVAKSLRVHKSTVHRLARERTIPTNEGGQPAAFHEGEHR